LVLRAMHGDECIASVTWQSKVNRGNEDELDRLRMFYNTENGKKLFAQLFPGATPTLPSTFKEIGFDVTEEGEVRDRNELQKKYQDELHRKMKEAAIAAGKDPSELKKISYDTASLG